MKSQVKRSAKPVRINTQQLIDLFLNFDNMPLFKGVAFGSIVYHTDESGSITRDKQKQLQKFVRTQITLGSSYEGRINRDLERRGEEANFTAQHLSGKEHVNKYVVQALKDNSKKYLCCVVEHHVTPDTVYFHKGKVIGFESAKEQGLFMPSYFEPKKTAGRGNMSEEKDFHYFTLGFDKIISLTVNGTRYLVRD
jgi:hypothetical protein